MQQFREVATGHARGDLVLLDGAHLVATALDAALPIPAAAITDAELDDPEFAGLASRLEAAGTDVAVVTGNLMAVISPVRSPSGLVALVERRLAAVAGLLGVPRALLVVAADVQDPGNLGALVRSAEAASATGVIASGVSADPLSWKALRGSMGSALRLPVAVALDTEELLADARRAGLRTVAAVAHGGCAPEEVDWRLPTAIFMGGEGPGLAQAVLEASDVRVTVPMAAPVESLNVSIAGALLLYAARRQRTAP
ncbi:MAG: TrmH family RNA methyltransferase [Vicinamibacterales bacterium]